MKTFLRSILVFLFILKLNVYGQKITLEQLLSTPFVSGLAASSKTGDFLLNINDKGARNVYIATAPTYQLKKLTQFNDDEGQEITSLQISDDGAWAVFTRGGDHGGNTAVRTPINSSSSVNKPRIAVYSINLKTAEVRLIDDGDYPSIRPNTKQLIYRSGGNVKVAALDGSVKPKTLFFDNGSPRPFKWSPDGKRLAFVSRRSTHSFIGIYEEGSPFIKWAAPSYYKDNFPVWSPDGSQIAFVRQEGSGMGADSASVKPQSSWQAVVYNLATKNAETVYSASSNPRAGIPTWSGGLNFSWPTANQLIFLSYQDGWPHLYTINLTTKTSKQLTKGKFSVSGDITYSQDGSKIAFSANYGPKEEDIDRRQLGIVDLKKENFKFITSGDNIFSSPKFINGDKSIVTLSSTAKRPVLPAIVDVEGKSDIKILAANLVSNLKYDELVVPEHVRYNSPDGVQVYAQLFKPKNIKSKVPAVIYLHGGPRRQMYLGWHHGEYYFQGYAHNQYLASQGYVVLSVNYRSGTGYGYSFQKAARTGKSGASEYQDVLAGAHWLAQQEFVNADKIGVYGGSYGGYLTALALGRNSDVFKVGVDIHGVHMRINNPGKPASLSKSELTALRSSPSYWADNWKSPVLIIHGDDDQNVKFQQSIDLYNRLKSRGIEAEALVIPNETHHWMTFNNLLEVKKATFNFLHKHLK